MNGRCAAIVDGGLEEEAKAQSDKQAGVFSARPIFLIPESSLYVKQENGSSNYQRAQWDRFLHAGWHFDLRGNNESNQKLTPALPLGSQPVCDMFTLGFEDLSVSVAAFCPLWDSVTNITKKKGI